MADSTIWKNVAVDMQSALGTAITITAVTKANPGVATSAAHGLTNGDVIVLAAQGMSDLDEKVVRVAEVTTDTFELEDIDTTEFDTFTSGTAQVITFGTSITTATTINASGGDYEFVDTTTIHKNIKTQQPGLPNAVSYAMDHIWDASDPGQIAMKAASDVQGKRAFRLRFGTGGKLLYLSGYVGASGLPGGAAQQLVTTAAVITMNGTPTFYAS